MNCAEIRERLTDYLEGTLAGESGLVEAHLGQCPECREELAKLERLRRRLEKGALLPREAPLEDRVMDRILAEQALELKRLRMRKRRQILGIGIGSLAAAAAIALVTLWAPLPDQRAVAAEYLARAAAESARLKSVHLQCRVRTRPEDNFGLIGAEYPFVEVNVWRQFGTPAKYRIEKPGRVLVSDGDSTVMLWGRNHAIKGPTGADFDAGWLRDLADVESVLDDQLRRALAERWDLSVKQEKGEGRPKTAVTVETRASDVGGYLRNKFLDTADTRRVFRFDAATKRLEELSIYLHDGRDVLIFEVTQIDYDPELPAATFVLELPGDVVWYEPPKAGPDAAALSAMKPEEVTRAFLEACGRKDWDEAKKFWPASEIDEPIRRALEGLKVIRIGEPFQAKPYPGWFVPYEIEFTSGERRKSNLAIRQDNPARQWVFDGGL